MAHQAKEHESRDLEMGPLWSRCKLFKRSEETEAVACLCVPSKQSNSLMTRRLQCMVLSELGRYSLARVENGELVDLKS